MSSTPTIQKPSSAIVEARLKTGFLSTFPTPRAEDLKTAYQFQDEAISLINKKIVGWKIGRIVGNDVSKHGTDRLFGPIFNSKIFHFDSDEIEIPVYPKGFAAVESEVIFEIGEDAPEGKTVWSEQEAKDLISNAYAGVEVASSPFPGVNENGPLVTITDLGNNFGLIVGKSIENWRDFDCKAWQFETFIENQSVGKNNASEIPGSPIESLRSLLENTAQRNLPLKKGMLITTGAVTGVHDIKVGQSSTICFQNNYNIYCRFVEQELPLSGIE